MRNPGLGGHQYADETQLFVCTAFDADRVSTCAFLISAGDWGMGESEWLGDQSR